MQWNLPNTCSLTHFIQFKKSKKVTYLMKWRFGKRTALLGPVNAHRIALVKLLGWC